MQVGFRVECRHRETHGTGGVFGAEGEIDQTKPDQSRRDNPEISPLTEKALLHRSKCSHSICAPLTSSQRQLSVLFVRPNCRENALNCA